MAVLGTAGFNGNALYTVQNRGPILRRFYPRCLAARLMNHIYEPELKKHGSRVTIPQRPVISTSAWTAAKEFTYPVVTPPDAKELIIDQASCYEFSVDLIDSTQTYLKGFLSDWKDEAARRLQITVDTTALNAAPALVDPSNTGNTAGGGAGVGTGGPLNLGSLENPVNLTPGASRIEAGGKVYTNAVKFVSDCSTALAKNNIDPELQRFVIGDPMLQNCIANSDIKSALVTGDNTGVIRSGPDHLGKVQGMDVFTSTLYTPLVNQSGQLVYPTLFGVDAAWSIVLQLQDMWEGQLINRAATGYRGTLVWGFAVPIPTGLGCGYVTFDGL